MKLIISLLLVLGMLPAFGQSASVPNIAALTNRPPSTVNPTVMTQGQFTPGDGKGGVYVWVDGSSAAVDNTNVLASSVRSGGRWLLSFPSATPLLPDPSKVDKVSGTASGLTVTGGLTGSGTVRFNGQDALTVGSPFTAGQIPEVVNGTTLRSSGFTTNAIKFNARVLRSVDDLVAVDPQVFLASGGNPIAYFTTISNGVSGAYQQHWMWDSTMTGATNFAYAGGPLAYPYGSASGRWFMVRPYTIVEERTLVMEARYPDSSDGTMNPSDPGPYFNSVYSDAEAAYDPVLGPVTVQHPGGTFTSSELIICGHVRYKSDNVFHVKKRFNPSGVIDRSLVRTRRLGFMDLDPVDGSFLNWGAAGGTNDYYANPDNWYGLSDGISFIGEGKFIFDQNNKDLILPLVKFHEVRDFYVQHGVIEAWHNASTNGSGVGNNNWAINLCGRDIIWDYPIIRGGTLTYQDGLHIGWGRDIFINGGFGESGDDSVVCQAEAAGAFTNPPDEPLERVYIHGWKCKSTKGRGANLHAGINWVQVPYVNRDVELKNIIIDGVVGTAGVARQSGMQMGSYQDGSGIWNYEITNPGSGYTNGYYTNVVGSVGGGSGAQCIVKVEGGQITRAHMAKISGTFRFGTGYRQDQLVSVGSIPGGSGAVVTGIVFGSPNYRIQNCTIKNFAISVGSPEHDDVEPYALRIHGATDSTIGPGTFWITDNTANPTYPTNSWRPYVIQAASNCVVKDVFFSPCYRGGSIAANDIPKSYITGITFDGCTIGPMSNPSQGVCKINGDTVGRVSFRNSILKVNTGTACFYIPDIESSKVCHSDLLEVDHCTIMADSGASNTRAIDFVPNAGGTGNMVGMLRFVNNNLVNITTADSISVIQAAATAYHIDGNSGGYRTKLGNVVTQLSGATQVSVTVSTVTGLPDNTTASLPCIRVVPLGNPGSNWWVEPSTTGAFLIKTASAVGSDLNWAVYVDTSRKPLTAY